MGLLNVLFGGRRVERIAVATPEGTSIDAADFEHLVEERAAIMEFDGGLSRELAERQARLDIVRLYGKPAARR